MGAFTDEEQDHLGGVVTPQGHSPNTSPTDDHKVNGEDVSQATHEDALETLKSAKEPIIVEVLRRVNNKTKMKSKTPAMISVATQTDLDIYSYPEQQPPSPPPFNFWDFHSNGYMAPMFGDHYHTQRYIDHDPDGHSHMDCGDVYIDDRPYEVEYEEVVLHRENSHQKLGLTLCYGSLEDEVTDIFISEVEPSGLAASDGRIREGDQILQINGVSVHNRERAIQLFADHISDVTLLLARPQLQFDDGFMESQNVLDESNLKLHDQHHHQCQRQHNRALLLPDLIDEEDGTTDTGTTETSHKHEKDSGVGRTDESTKNDESSEQEDSSSSPTTNVTYRHSRKLHTGADFHQSNDSFTSNDIPDIDHDNSPQSGNDGSNDHSDHFTQVLQNRCLKLSADAPLPKTDSDIDQELALLNQEMEKIQMECQKIVQAHIRDHNKMSDESSAKSCDPYRSPRLVPRMGTRMDAMKYGSSSNDPAECSLSQGSDVKLSPPSSRMSTLPHCSVTKLVHTEKDTATVTTTSAYNTGESCRSTPLTLELNKTCDGSPHNNKPVFLHVPAVVDSHSDTEKQTQTSGAIKTCVVSDKSDTNDDDYEQLDIGTSLLSLGQPADFDSNINRLQNLNESLQDLYARYAEVMYTNEANLQHTIAIQQKLFQQQLTYKGRKRVIFPDLSQEKCTSPSVHNNNNNISSTTLNTPDSDKSAAQMEWVVKRRPDGSRYITRRPIRNKLLKERAKKVAEERSGLTTDDDAMSELKFGRYWSKDERKRHLEKSKEQKKRKENLQKLKMETVKEDGMPQDKNLNILELSHKKMLRQKGKKVLDNFVTVQEMLAHGSRVCTGKTYNPLLSVTTV